MLFKEITSEEFAEEIRAKGSQKNTTTKAAAKASSLVSPNLIAAYREFHLSDDQILKVDRKYQIEETEAFGLSGKIQIIKNQKT